MALKRRRQRGEGYCEPHDVQDELAPDAWDNPNVQERVPGWITRWSGNIDDMIRSKYQTPFPDFPYAPESLRTACAYYVTHQVFVYLGLDRSDEDSNPGSYYNLAEKIIKDIREGTTQLETEFEIPADNGKTERVVVEDANTPLYSSVGTNPLSIQNQILEFGPPVRSSRGNFYTDGSIHRVSGTGSSSRRDRLED